MNKHLKCLIKLPATILLIPLFLVVLIVGGILSILLLFPCFILQVSGCYDFDEDPMTYFLETLSDCLNYWSDL